jgi:RNA-binding protein 5/10
VGCYLSFWGFYSFGFILFHLHLLFVSNEELENLLEKLLSGHKLLGLESLSDCRWISLPIFPTEWELRDLYIRSDVSMYWHFFPCNHFANTQGLGKNGSGIKEPVQAKSGDVRAGLGSQQKKAVDPSLEAQAGDSYKTIIQKKAIARFREMS